MWIFKVFVSFFFLFLWISYSGFCLFFFWTWLIFKKICSIQFWIGLLHSDEVNPLGRPISWDMHVWLGRSCLILDTAPHFSSLILLYCVYVLPETSYYLLLAKSVNLGCNHLIWLLLANFPITKVVFKLEKCLFSCPPAYFCDCSFLNF